jgi:hypothetical protein
VTKIKAGVLFIAVGLGFSVPPVALARTSFAQNTAPSNAKKTRKAYLKQQKKQQKRTKKAQNKAQKNNRKLHPTGN